MRHGVRRRRRTDGRAWPRLLVAVSMLLAGVAGPTSAAAQGLADYDYTNLGFRGVGLEVGRLVPSSVDPTTAVTASLDLGYLGPGFQVVPSLTYWSSDLTSSKVGEFESRLDDLVQREAGAGAPRPDIKLGPITWTDVALTVDGHFVWNVPWGFQTRVGGGVTAHLLNGQGSAINGTFVEDLLDSVRAGFNLHAGLEHPLYSKLHLLTSARYEVLGDLQYLELRLGTELMIGPARGAGAEPR